MTVHLIGDGYRWATDADVQDLEKILRKAEIHYSAAKFSVGADVFYANRYAFLEGKLVAHLRPSFVGLNYFHGHPNTHEKFSLLLDKLSNKGDRVTKIRTSHTAMKNLLESRGFEGRVQVIRIPVDCDAFRPPDRTERDAMRRQLGIPDTATVIGSFQKDGEGWGTGDRPKLEKGPDILCQTLTAYKKINNELLVLLTGPSRGFVTEELTRSGVNFLHVTPEHQADMAKLYWALDGYLIPSRDEGGPKGALEAMASGVPVVSTPVGQAKDLIVNDSNGWVSGTFEPEELTHLLDYAIAGSTQWTIGEARATAKANDLSGQTAAWKEFFGRDGSANHK